MNLIMLFGSGAVGKMTVGQELTKITDYRLFHNHMIIEPVLEAKHYDNNVLRWLLALMVYEGIIKGTSKNVKFPLAYHTPPKNQGDFAKKCMNLS